MAGKRELKLVTRIVSKKTFILSETALKLVSNSVKNETVRPYQLQKVV